MAAPTQLAVAKAADVIRQSGGPVADDPLSAAPTGRVAFVQNPTGRKVTAVIELVITYSDGGIVVVPLSINGAVNLASELLAALKLDAGGAFTIKETRTDDEEESAHG